MKNRLPTWWVVSIAFGLASVLAAITYREGRRLTFDAYHYCELAKQFTSEWPDRFGNHWPFGYPLAGALLARCGLPAFESLVLVSAVALLVLLSAATIILGSHPLRLLVLAALAATPIVSLQFFGILTELPFAALLLALTICLASWPGKAAIWGAAGCAVAALAVRYAGIIALAILAAWLLWQWRSLRHRSRLSAAIVATLTALFLILSLLGLNVARSGYASGAERTGAPGLGALPGELADFGWSMPSALFAGGLRDRIGSATPTGLLLGGLAFVLLAALCLWAWWRPRTRFSQPLALVALAYAAGMGVLHCFGSFDALHNARTFLPILFPTGLLIAERLESHAWLATGCGLLLASGITAAARGISQQIAGDVRPAVSVIRPLLKPDETVAINDHAFSLSAYIRQRTVRTWPEYWQETAPERLVVIAAKPQNRTGGGAVAAEWLQRLDEIVGKNAGHYLVKSARLIVIERSPAETNPSAP